MAMILLYLPWVSLLLMALHEDLPGNPTDLRHTEGESSEPQQADSPVVL